ncbi:MAG: Dabb family protein [bacterium]
MLHRILLAKLHANSPPEKVEELMIESRIRLLKIPEALNLRCGKSLEEKDAAYDFFLSIETENSSKMRIIEESAIYLKFQHQVLEKLAAKISQMDFEMEPGKDVRFS